MSFLKSVSAQAIPNIDSFTLKVPAGVDSILTIHGDGFGTSPGKITFEETDPRLILEFFILDNYDLRYGDGLIEWTDNRIRLKLPSQSQKVTPIGSFFLKTDVPIFSSRFAVSRKEVGSMGGANFIQSDWTDIPLTVPYSIKQVIVSDNIDPENNISKLKYKLTTKSGNSDFNIFLNKDVLEYCELLDGINRAISSLNCEFGIPFKIIDFTSDTLQLNNNINTLSLATIDQNDQTFAQTHFSDMICSDSVYYSVSEVDFDFYKLFYQDPCRHDEYFTTLHEFGHSLGLMHTNPGVSPQKRVMNPFYVENPIVTQDDIDGFMASKFYPSDFTCSMSSNINYRICEDTPEVIECIGSEELPVIILLNNTIEGECHGRVQLHPTSDALDVKFLIKNTDGDTQRNGMTSTDTILIEGLCEGEYTIEFSTEAGCFVNSIIVGACGNIGTGSVIFTENATSCDTPDGSLRLFGTGGNTEIVHPIQSRWWTWNGRNFDLELNEDGGDSSNGTRDELFAGEYCYFIEDANGCIGRTCKTIEYDSAPTIDLIETLPTCLGTSSGTIEVFASLNPGPNPEDDLYRIVLFDSEETAIDSLVGISATFDGLPVGEYRVEVSWVNNLECVVSEEAKIVSFDPGTLAPLSLTVSPVAPCPQEQNGQILVEPAGGFGPYTIDWTPSISSDNDFARFNLNEGNYSYTVTDRCGSTISGSEELKPIIASISYDQGCSSGFISVSTIGGGGDTPYTYSWSNGDTIYFASQLPNGTYTVTVTGASGCEMELGPIEVENTSVAIVQTDPTCGGALVGEAEISIINPFDRGVSFSLNGNNIQLIPNDDNFETYTITDIGEGETVQIDVEVGECSFSETLEIASVDITTELNTFEGDTCFFDQLCNGEVINSSGILESPTIDVVVETGLFSTCVAPVFCGTNLVSIRESNLQVIRVGVYRQLLIDAENQGVIGPDAVSALTRLLGEPGTEDCNRLIYCPLTLANWGDTWLINRPGNLEQLEDGCIELRCGLGSNFNLCEETQEIVRDNRITFGGGTFDPVRCNFKTMPTKQLLIWRDSMITAFGEEFVISTLNDHLINLENELFGGEIFGQTACSSITFCRNDFRFVSSNFQSTDCYQIDTLWSVNDTIVRQVEGINSCELVESSGGIETWICRQPITTINEVEIYTEFDEEVFDNLVAPTGEDEVTSTVAIQNQYDDFFFSELGVISTESNLSTKIIAQSPSNEEIYVDFSPFRLGSKFKEMKNLEFYFADYEMELHYFAYRNSLHEVVINIDHFDGNSYSRSFSTQGELKLNYSRFANNRELLLVGDGPIFSNGQSLSNTNNSHQLQLKLHEFGEFESMLEVKQIGNVGIEYSSLTQSVSGAGTRTSGIATQDKIIHLNGTSNFLGEGQLFSISSIPNTIHRVQLPIAKLPNIDLLASTILSSNTSTVLISGLEENTPPSPQTGPNTSEVISLVSFDATSSSVSTIEGSTSNYILKDIPEGKGVLLGFSFEDELSVDGHSFLSQGGQDIFIGHFSTTGKLLKYRTYGSPDNEDIKQLIYDEATEQIHFGGNYSGSSLTRMIGLIQFLQLVEPDGTVLSYNRPYATHVGLAELEPVKEEKSQEGLAIGNSSIADGLIVVSPNPATDVINFSIDTRLNAKSIVMIDGLGRVIYQKEITVSGQFISLHSIDTSNLPSGMYFYVVGGDYGNVSGKIFIK